MKRLKITKASREQAILTPPSKEERRNKSSSTPSSKSDDRRSNDNNNPQQHDASGKSNRIETPSSRPSSTSSRSGDENNSVLLLMIPLLLIFVGLPLMAFVYYMIQQQIRVERETGISILVTVVVGAVIALASQVTSGKLLAFFRKNDQVPTKEEENSKLQGALSSLKKNDRIQPQEEEEEEWIQPKVRIKQEATNDGDVPMILKEQDRQSIAEHVLPRTLADHYWRRLYSLARDGDTFDVCLKALEDEARTLIVIRTSKGEILGGFVSAAWKTSTRGLVKRDEGAASGAAVFSIQPKWELNENNFIDVYKWTGANRYTQLVDVDQERLAMGAAGGELADSPAKNLTAMSSFAWSVERSFLVGTTGRCPTFDNDPLCSQERFEVVDLEVFGFSVC